MICVLPATADYSGQRELLSVHYDLTHSSHCHSRCCQSVIVVTTYLYNQLDRQMQGDVLALFPVSYTHLRAHETDS